MSTSTVAPATAKQVEVIIDGKTITIDETATIFDAATRLGINIPALCHRPDLGLNPVAVCRACMVDVGEKGFPAACARQCGTLPKDKATGKLKEVLTHSPDLEAVRKTLVELLLAEHPRPCKRHQETQDCELELLGEKYGLLEPLRQPRTEAAKYKSVQTMVSLSDEYGKLASDFWERAPKKQDRTNFSIAVDHSACILCDRCVRACNDVAEHYIIGRNSKGHDTLIGFDNNKPMGDSGCVNCGWCMVACPTGALVYTGGGRKDAFPDALSVSDMEELPFIKAARVSANFLRRLEGGIRVRNFKKGELICRQGERGHTAFFIDSGKADIYVASMKQVAAKTGLWSKISSLLGPGRAANGASAHVVLDGDSSGTLVNQVPEADSLASRLVGEASCRNSLPRSATVRAAEEMVVLEMHRDVLDILLRSPGFRDDFERSNRRRMIQSQLRSTPLFSGLPQKDLEWLETQGQLVNFKPGDEIFKQGDAADAFYVIRLGHVKVSADSQVIGYVNRSKPFGEIALLGDLPRTATCAAMDNVEALRLDKPVFDELLRRYPPMRDSLAKVAEARIGDDVNRSAVGDPKRSIELQQYVKQELFEGQSLLVIDLDLCTRCDECVQACAQSHNGVARMIRDGNRFQHYLVPTACRSCHDAKCVPACPVDAIHRTEAGGLAIIVENSCVGCGNCFGEDHDGNPTGTGCPYGNIFPVPATLVDPITGEETAWRKASVCDLDNCTAEKQEPSCVYACPHEAAHRVNAHDFFGKHLLSNQHGGVEDN